MQTDALAPRHQRMVNGTNNGEDLHQTRRLARQPLSGCEKSAKQRRSSFQRPHGQGWPTGPTPQDARKRPPDLASRAALAETMRREGLAPTPTPDTGRGAQYGDTPVRAVRCGLPGRRLVARRGARPTGRTPATRQTPAAVSAAQRGYTGTCSARSARANHRLVWQRRGRVHPSHAPPFCPPAALFA